MPILTSIKADKSNECPSTLPSPPPPRRPLASRWPLPATGCGSFKRGMSGIPADMATESPCSQKCSVTSATDAMPRRAASIPSRTVPEVQLPQCPYAATSAEHDSAMVERSASLANALALPLSKWMNSTPGSSCDSDFSTCFRNATETIILCILAQKCSSTCSRNNHFEVCWLRHALTMQPKLLF